MTTWKGKIKSEHGKAVDFLEPSVGVYDNDNYCRGFVNEVVFNEIEYAKLIINQKRDEYLGFVSEEEFVRLFKLNEKPMLKFTPSVGTIVDTRVNPAVDAGHKDVIKYLIDNVPQIKEPIYHLDNIQDLRDATELPRASIDFIAVSGDGSPSPN